MRTEMLWCKKINDTFFELKRLIKENHCIFDRLKTCVWLWLDEFRDFHPWAGIAEYKIKNYDAMGSWNTWVYCGHLIFDIIKSTFFFPCKIIVFSKSCWIFGFLRQLILIAVCEMSNRIEIFCFPPWAVVTVVLFLKYDTNGSQVWWVCCGQVKGNGKWETKGNGVKK